MPTSTVEWLFNRTVVRRPPTGTDKAGMTTPETGKEGAFVSSEALFSFTGMTASIALATAVLHHMGLQSAWTGAILTLIAGAFLYYVHETDPGRIGDPRSPVRIAVAVVNTLQIYAAVYGVSVATGTLPPP